MMDVKPTIQLLVDEVYLPSLGPIDHNSFVGLSILWHRTKKGLTQSQFGLSKANFYKLEKGTARITVNHLYAIAVVLGITVSDILVTADTLEKEFTASTGTTVPDTMAVTNTPRLTRADL